MTNQRDHFRVEYPKPDRPTIKIDKHSYEVIDLSEKGVKFDCGKTFRPQQNAPLAGTIVFQDKKTCDVVGTVLRYLADKNQCVAILSQGIPLTKMMEEHRMLLKKYKSA
jgi:hypothetical protein